MAPCVQRFPNALVRQSLDHDRKAIASEHFRDQGLRTIGTGASIQSGELTLAAQLRQTPNCCNGVIVIVQQAERLLSAKNLEESRI